MVRVQAEPFDAAEAIGELTAGRTDIGAVVTFTGLVRGGADGVRSMTLEHYPGMTESALEEIEREARARWPLDGVVMIHRTGRLRPGEPIVLVATASAHRGAAFEAAEFLMDYLKTEAPLWKQEELPSGNRWVEARAEDDDARARWEGTDPATPKTARRR